MRTVFFCGHKSSYGLAHFKPFLDGELNIVAVVLANENRWDIFREKISGEDYYGSHSPGPSFRSLIKRAIPDVMLDAMRKGGKPIQIEALVNEYSVPIWYAEDVNSRAFIEKLKGLKADLFVSAAYPQIFSEELIAEAERGAINCHPSLLPKFRGAHPHYWSIVKGAKVSGLTAHFMTAGIDEGAIIAQVEYEISQYNYSQLYEKIIQETPELVSRLEKFMSDSKNLPMEQDDSKATYFKNDREIHHRIFWSIQNAEEVGNLIRGGGAFCLFRSQKIEFVNATISEKHGNLTNDIKVENGIIVGLNEDSISVSTAKGIVNVSEVIYGDKQLLAPDFIRKHSVFIGEKFD